MGETGHQLIKLQEQVVQGKQRMPLVESCLFHWAPDEICTSPWWLS